MMRAKTGAIITREASDGLAVWRNDVAEATRRAVEGALMTMPWSEQPAPWTGPVCLNLDFKLKAPMVLARQYARTWKLEWEKGHANAMTERWPGMSDSCGFMRKINGPDLDKLVRAVCDGIVAGGAIIDDRQIFELNAGKYQALEDGEPVTSGVDIRLKLFEGKGY